MKQPIERFTLRTITSVTPNAAGNLCHYQFFACGPWQTDTEPEENAFEPILCDVNGKPVILYFHGGRFRNTSGNPWTKPSRWAYIRMLEDTWDGQTWKLGDGSTPPSAGKPDLGQTLLLLSQYFNKIDVLDAIDMIEWADGKGEPLS